MTDRIAILDHGYVRLVESWGHGDAGAPEDRHNSSGPDFRDDNECGIVEAARQSTQGSFRGWDRDAKLLKYLSDNNHATPFEFAGMVVEVRAPIFVFREWHRHRTMSYNEMSARYSPLPALDYLPTVERCVAGADWTNRQAGRADGTDPITGGEAMVWVAALDTLQQQSRGLYERGLLIGVPKEVARLALTVGAYSQMRASANLRNWLSFVTLRADPAAQEEIRMYAEAVGTILAREFPRTWELFDAGRNAAADESDCRKVVAGLAERVAAQSALLSRKAEKSPCWRCGWAGPAPAE